MVIVTNKVMYPKALITYVDVTCNNQYQIIIFSIYVMHLCTSKKWHTSNKSGKTYSR